MEISTKKLAVILALTIVLSVGVTSAYFNPIVFMHRDPTMRANVYVTIQQRFGTTQCTGGNLITDIGERYVRNIIGFNNVTAHNATDDISLSNDGSPLDTWTKLPNEVTGNGFDRVDASSGTVAWWNGTDYAFNVTHQFTATGTQQLQCAGLNWHPTDDVDNTLFAAALFTQTTFESGDNLTITWVITFDAND